MKFTIPPNKNYNKDIVLLKEAVQNGEHITFSKFCDGEWAVLQNSHIDNKEFHFNPSIDSFKRQKLLEAFQYNNENERKIHCPVSLLFQYDRDTGRRCRQYIVFFLPDNP